MDRCETNWTVSEANREVKRQESFVLPFAVVECRHTPGTEETDLGTNLDVRRKVVAQSEAVAGVGGAKSRSLASRVPVEFVSERDEIPLRELEHGIVEDAEIVSDPWDVRSDS